MNKEELTKQLKLIAEEARGSLDPEVRGTAGILYSLLGALAMDQTFQFVEFSANFSEQMLANIATAEVIHTVTKR